MKARTRPFPMTVTGKKKSMAMVVVQAVSVFVDFDHYNESREQVIFTPASVQQRREKSYF